MSAKLISIKWLSRLLWQATNGKVKTKPDVSIGGEENPYLRRWFVIPRNRFFNIYLHEILRSDDDRALHDHPWWNVSIILDGQMLEVLNNDGSASLHLKQGDVVGRGAETLHRLEVFDDVICRSLFITGPHVREWGFQCPQGWRHWKIFTGFNETGDGTRIGRGCVKNDQDSKYR